MGTLYLVGTPIGNLEDITLRALRILREVQLIAAEDTRRTKTLLHHYEIPTPLISFHAHSGPERLEQLLAALREGDIALVSDAGMPGISDPGAELVRAAVAAGHRVAVVPGPSAVTAAAALSGLVTDGFVFAGFLPRRGREREERLRTLADPGLPLILFEAPHRLRQTLVDAIEILGDRPVAVCRELTKHYEEVWYTTLSQALDRIGEHEPRGEFVVVIAPARATSPQWEEETVLQLLVERLNRGLPVNTVARELAQLTGWPRRELYQRALRLRKEAADSTPKTEGESV